MCTLSAVPVESTRGHQSPWGLSYWCLWAPDMVLGTPLQSSAGATSTPSLSPLLGSPPHHSLTIWGKKWGPYHRQVQNWSQTSSMLFPLSKLETGVKRKCLQPKVWEKLTFIIYKAPPQIGGEKKPNRRSKISEQIILRTRLTCKQLGKEVSLFRLLSTISTTVFYLS